MKESILFTALKTIGVIYIYMYNNYNNDDLVQSSVRTDFDDSNHWFIQPLTHPKSSIFFGLLYFVAVIWSQAGMGGSPYDKAAFTELSGSKGPFDNRKGLWYDQPALGHRSGRHKTQQDPWKTNISHLKESEVWNWSNCADMGMSQNWGINGPSKC